MRRRRKMTQGIYRIYNTKNKKSYVGSSICVERRWVEHFKLLKFGKHHSIKLQRAWDKAEDKDIFITEILEIIKNKDDLETREQFYIDSLDSFKKGYNCCAVVNNPYYSFSNFKLSEMSPEQRKVLHKRKINKKRKEKEGQKKIEEEKLKKWNLHASNYYNMYKSHPSIFFRKSYVYQLEHFNGGFYKIRDFIFLCKMIEYFFDNFDEQEYSLSIWRTGASIDKGKTDNSQKHNEDIIVEYGFYYCDYDLENEEIPIYPSYKNTRFFDYYYQTRIEPHFAKKE